MTAMGSGKGNAIPAMVIKTVAALCLMAMIGGCSSGRTSRTNGVAANGSEDSSNAQPCLTKEQKYLKMKEISEKESFWERKKKSLLVRGGGNVIGSLIGVDSLGEYADNANGVREMTVKGERSRDFIDAAATKDCDSQNQPAAAEPSTTNEALAGK